MTLRPAPLVASLLLHGLLLWLALYLVLPISEFPALIPVSFIGGGRGDGGEPSQGAGGAAAPAAAPVAVAPVPAVAAVAPPAMPPKPAAVTRPQPVVAAKPRIKAVEPAPPRPVPAAPQAAIPPQPATAPAAAAHDAANTTSGGAVGGGSGSGSGTDAGSGSGTGLGPGGGPGSGPGSGGGADLRAFCLQCPEPSYPRLAVMRGWQGKVWVELALSPEGTVAEATVARSSGFALLDDAAVQVARQSHFRVADRRSGLLAYTFRLTETP